MKTNTKRFQSRLSGVKYLCCGRYLWLSSTKYLGHWCHMCSLSILHLRVNSWDTVWAMQWELHSISTLGYFHLYTFSCFRYWTENNGNAPLCYYVTATMDWSQRIFKSYCRYEVSLWNGWYECLCYLRAQCHMMLQDKIIFMLLSVSWFAALEVKMLTFKIRMKLFTLISNWNELSVRGPDRWPR